MVPSSWIYGWYTVQLLSGIRLVYGWYTVQFLFWYTVGIRWSFFGIRLSLLYLDLVCGPIPVWYTAGIRWYTVQFLFWYTAGIRVDSLQCHIFILKLFI